MTAWGATNREVIHPLTSTYLLPSTIDFARRLIFIVLVAMLTLSRYRYFTPTRGACGYVTRRMLPAEKISSGTSQVKPGPRSPNRAIHRHGDDSASRVIKLLLSVFW